MIRNPLPIASAPTPNGPTRDESPLARARPPRPDTLQTQPGTTTRTRPLTWNETANRTWDDHRHPNRQNGGTHRG